MSNKFVRFLQSRKFWVSLIGLLSVAGLYWGDDIEAAKLVDSILLIVGALVASIAAEDGLAGIGKGRG